MYTALTDNNTNTTIVVHEYSVVYSHVSYYVLVASMDQEALPGATTALAGDDTMADA